MLGYPQEHINSYVNYTYAVLAYSSDSDNQKALTAAFKYGGYAENPLTETNRLGNPDLPFPIAFAFGDRDWIGTAGADQIIKAN